MTTSTVDVGAAFLRGVAQAPNRNSARELAQLLMTGRALECVERVAEHLRNGDVAAVVELLGAALDLNVSLATAVADQMGFDKPVDVLDAVGQAIAEGPQTHLRVLPSD